MNASVASYREHAILTAPPERLVAMMYQGACRFLLQAEAAMEQANVEQSNGKLQRAEAIIEELRRTLDMSAGEIAENLGAIYTFCLRHLMQARIDRDPEKVGEVRDLLEELGEAWDQIVVP